MVLIQATKNECMELSKTLSEMTVDKNPYHEKKSWVPMCITVYSDRLREHHPPSRIAVFVWRSAC